MNTILIYYVSPNRLAKNHNLQHSFNKSSCMKHILLYCGGSVYWNRSNVGYMAIFIIVPSCFHDYAPTSYISTQSMARCGFSLPHLYHLLLPLIEILISSFYAFTDAIMSELKFPIQIS